MDNQTKEEVIDEIIGKAIEQGKFMRSVDPKLFPTMIIRAEAIEDFAKSLKVSPDKPVPEQEELWHKAMDIYHGQHAVYGKPDFRMLKDEFILTRKPKT